MLLLHVANLLWLLLLLVREVRPLVFSQWVSVLPALAVVAVSPVECEYRPLAVAPLAARSRWTWTGRC